MAPNPPRKLYLHREPQWEIRNFKEKIIFLFHFALGKKNFLEDHPKNILTNVIPICSVVLEKIAMFTDNEFHMMAIPHMTLWVR